MGTDKSTLEQLRIDRSGRTDKDPSSRIWIAVVILILLLGGGAAWWFQRAGPVAVRTWVVREANGANPGGSRTVLNASGYVTARREATVSSKVTGKVTEVLIEEGKVVKAGDLLARLDDTNAKASLQLAEAQTDAARSALGETKVRFEEAERELRRITELATNKIATASELDKAQAEVNSLRARLDRQQMEVTVAERQVAVWKQQLDDTVIRAPFSGIVTSKNAQPGEMISPMSSGGFTRTGICTIVDMTSLEVEVDVNESFINRVEPGQPVESTLDAYPEWKIPSKVIAIIPTADRQKATVRVRVGFDQLDPRMLPQMGVKVAFRGTDENGAPARALTIPRNAVLRSNEQDFILVVRDGRVERRAVKLGALRNDEFTVAAGVSDGERLVIEGREKLADGTRVKEAK